MRNQLPSTPERATFRKLGILLLALALVAGAGCSGTVLGGSDGDDGSGGEPIEYVPADQNVVVEFDMAIAQDPTTQRLVSEGEDETESQELRESLSAFEAETGLDPSGFNSMLVYGQTDQTTTSVDEASSQEDFGAIVETDWSTDELTSAIESNESVSLVEQDYTESGVLYEVQSETDDSDEEVYLGVHGDGVFVIGTEDPVRNSLDVTYDGGNALEGELRDAYDDTRDGYVTFAMTLPEQDTGSQGSLAGSMTNSLGALTGVYYTDDGTIGVEGRMGTESKDIATTLNVTIHNQLASFQDDPQYSQALQYLEVSTDGSDLVLTYEADVETILEASDE